MTAPGPPAGALIVGVVSDTHGVLLPEVIAALDGAALILHAGDIGSMSILRRLEEVAPVQAVHGNNDDALLRRHCPAERLVEAGGIRIAVVHGDRWPSARRPRLMAEHFAAQGVRVIVFGHTHKPEIQEQGGILVFNPGSAGKRNFGRPLTIGRLVIDGGQVTAAVIPIG